MVPAFDRFTRWFGTTRSPRPLYCGQWSKTQTPQKMEAKQIEMREKQRPVVKLVSPLAQATEMARSEVGNVKIHKYTKFEPIIPRESRVMRIFTN